MNNLLTVIVMIFFLGFLSSCGGAISAIMSENPTPEDRISLGITIVSVLALGGINLAGRNKSGREDD